MKLLIPCLIGAWLLASVCFMWHLGFIVSLVLAVAWIWGTVYIYFSNR